MVEFDLIFLAKLGNTLGDEVRRQAVDRDQSGRERVGRAGRQQGIGVGVARVLLVGIGGVDDGVVAGIDRPVVVEIAEDPGLSGGIAASVAEVDQGAESKGSGVFERMDALSAAGAEGGLQGQFVGGAFLP